MSANLPFSSSTCEVKNFVTAAIGVEKGTGLPLTRNHVSCKTMLAAVLPTPFRLHAVLSKKETVVNPKLQRMTLNPVCEPSLLFFHVRGETFCYSGKWGRERNRIASYGETMLAAVQPIPSRLHAALSKLARERVQEIHLWAKLVTTNKVSTQEQKGVAERQAVTLLK